MSACSSSNSMIRRDIQLLCCVLLLIVQSSQGGFLDTVFRRNDDTASSSSQGRRKNGRNNSTSTTNAGQVPTTTLSNGVEFPLIGAGMGHLEQYDNLEEYIAHAMNDGQTIKLFDVSHQAEEHVSKGIAAASVSSDNNNNRKKKKKATTTVHIITKVWYTHLGYDRTKHAVQESLKALQQSTNTDNPNNVNIDVKVHVLLQWPRCYDSIQWMDCEQEERDLPSHVQQLGPPPHLNRQTAFQESWQALEDLYNSDAIASIGISNFQVKDLEALLHTARIKPHLLQMSVWSLLHDPILVALCEEHGIHVQAFHVMQSVWKQAPNVAPHAYHHLLMVANAMQVQAPQLILKWFLQHEVSVIPRASSIQQYDENMAAVDADFTAEHYEIVADCIEAVLSGNDLPEDAFVTVTFEAVSKETIVSWYHPNGRDEIPLAILQVGETYQDYTHPDHVYRMYDGDDTDIYKQVVVNGSYGESHHFTF